MKRSFILGGLVCSSILFFSCIPGKSSTSMIAPKSIKKAKIKKEGLYPGYKPKYFYTKDAIADFPITYKPKFIVEED